MENLEMMEVNSFNISADINESTAAMYCSIDRSTREGQMLIYNALNAPTGRLADMIGKTILVTDVIAEPTSITNDDGTIVNTVRLVLVTVDGKSYSCVSIGIYNAIKKLISVFGLPTWTEPLALEIKQLQRKGRDGLPRNVLTLAMSNK